MERFREAGGTQDFYDELDRQKAQGEGYENEMLTIRGQRIGDRIDKETAQREYWQDIDQVMSDLMQQLATLEGYNMSRLGAIQGAVLQIAANNPLDDPRVHEAFANSVNSMWYQKHITDEERDELFRRLGMSLESMSSRAGSPVASMSGEVTRVPTGGRGGGPGNRP